MDQTILAVGTQKGLFVFRATDGLTFELIGRHLPGWEVSALLVRPGHNGLDLLAGTSHYAYGPVLRRSRDGGATWTQPDARPAYPAGSPHKTNRIWQLTHHAAENALYAGIDEAGLFRSADDGESWQEVTTLTAHPTRADWQPGGGGLCLHTIVHDRTNPRRTWCGISAVGVLRTEDSGATWTLANTGLQNVPTGSTEVHTAYCVHKMVQHPLNPDTLFMQFHGGVYVSEDGATTWHRRECGLPGNFGFPIVGLPDGTLLVAPLEGDTTRYFKDGRSVIYRSVDEGRSWQASDGGMADGPSFAGVLRDAMTTDGRRGVYFGTTSGEVAVSADAGKSWDRLAVTLPRVLCVRAVVTA